MLATSQRHTMIVGRATPNVDFNCPHFMRAVNGPKSFHLGRAAGANQNTFCRTMAFFIEADHSVLSNEFGRALRATKHQQIPIRDSVGRRSAEINMRCAKQKASG